MPKSQFSDAYASFLEILIAERKALGVTQAEVASRLGRDQPFISLVERGVRRVDVVEFVAIAKALGSEPEELFAKVAKGMPDRIQI